MSPVAVLSIGWVDDPRFGEGAGMRCHFMSDLHLEGQEFGRLLPKGDVLILAGDICNARCFEPKPHDLYAIRQRDRVLSFFDFARKRFPHVLMIAGNHEHYDGVFDDSIGLLRRHLPGITVLDDDVTEIDGVRFFGSTLWSDFEGRNPAVMALIRKRVGEYFFVRKRDEAAPGGLVRWRPEDALAAHDRALAALAAAIPDGNTRPTVVITHHAPSLKGLNPYHVGNGIDGAFASDLDSLIERLSAVPVWIHGHTHIRRQYRIGDTAVHVNCLGLEHKDPDARHFDPSAYVDIG